MSLLVKKLSNDDLKNISAENKRDIHVETATVRRTNESSYHLVGLHTFTDGCKIEISSDSIVRIQDGAEDLSYTEENKTAFKGETGECVTEYSGLATDGNPDRSWAKAVFEENGIAPAHFHRERVEDYYITASGAEGVIVIVDGQSHELKVGGHIQILARQVHQVINPSATHKVSLIVKCAASWVYTDHNRVA